MEQNLPIIAKKIWKIIQVAYFMLRKGISKAKLISTLNIMLKRGKIAGKEAIQNLIHHHHHHGAATSGRHEYEFSCSNSPAYPIFHLIKKRKHHLPERDSMMAAAAEMVAGAAATSPELPGFGPSPMVRRLRVTDSPFPIGDFDDDDHVVDEAAEEFIMRFYRDLRKQNYLGY